MTSDMVSVDPSTARMIRGAGIFAGLLTLVLGILVLVWPGVTIGVVVITVGIQFVVVGLLTLTAAITGEDGVGEKVLLSVLGILGLLAGVVTLARPMRSSVVLVVVIGAFWLVGGIVDLVASVFGRSVPGRAWRIVGAVVSVAAGAIALSWPGITVVALARVLGIWMVVFGGVMLVLGLTQRAE
ncbi:MAG: DUF308 domain-containing protein [Acidimicrobiia bacterium]|nr:DUF308 domain-containing protein [Acidimicrobiia bacterium]